ncbi:MAG: VanZ family protein [Lachnospiraceae bacterium]|jgi:VanZ family protein|nr:VanZ family protein [Lachnospiraceae bacterium]
MGYKTQKNKNHPVIAVMLWVCFLTAVAVVTYLSFQDGEESKSLGMHLIQYVADQKYPEQNASQVQMDSLIYQIRQFGRKGMFFVIGILGTMAIHFSFKKCNWVIKTGITAVILVAIAFLTERMKEFIPSRHYSYEEMMVSIVAVILGFALVSVITLILHTLRGVFRQRAATTHS